MKVLRWIIKLLCIAQVVVLIYKPLFSVAHEIDYSHCEDCYLVTDGQDKINLCMLLLTSPTHRMVVNDQAWSQVLD